MPDIVPISLVIPTYNRCDLIEESIAAALNQQEPFAEIIVVDDGSTDDTVQRLSTFGDRITLIRSGRGGVQNARNIGVAACKTAFVALCDSDDLLDAAFTRSLRRAIESSPATDIWYCNFTLLSGGTATSDKLALAPEGFLEGADRGEFFCVNIPALYERVLQYQPFFPTGSVFRKSFYDLIGGYDTSFRGVGSEDFEFLLRAISSGSLGYMTVPLAAVRKHEGNDSQDNLRSLLGEAQILEHSMKRHPGAAQFERSILESVDKRRRDAFDIAYARGDFSAVRDTASKLHHAPTDSNFIMKKVISRFPSFMRDMAWRISQSVH